MSANTKSETCVRAKAKWSLGLLPKRCPSCCREVSHLQPFRLLAKAGRSLIGKPPSIQARVITVSARYRAVRFTFRASGCTDAPNAAQSTPLEQCLCQQPRLLAKAQPIFWLKSGPATSRVNVRFPFESLHVLQIVHAFVQDADSRKAAETTDVLRVIAVKDDPMQTAGPILQHAFNILHLHR